VLDLALLVVLWAAGCKHAPAPQSRPLIKNEHSQQPAAAPARVEAPVPIQAAPARPRFAVQVAAFDQPADAEGLASRLSDQYRLQTLVAPVEARGKTLYRVRLLVQNKNQAKSLADTFLRTEKLKVWTVALP
jgi:cell division protein FtsN